jgi:DNA replication and repair protein RecF
MQVTRIRLQNYRNIPFVDLTLDGLTQFFVGSNAQGKSNLLEGLGLLSALRSFRTQDMNTLLMHGKQEAKLAFDLNAERFGSTEVWVTLKRKGKEVEVDGEKVTRFRDFIGRFPVVLLSSQDIQLLRGSPGVRRQWLNLVLSSGSSLSYDTLKDFHKLLQERNSLLKANRGHSEIEVFEKMLAANAAQLRADRREEIAKLDSLLKDVYRIVSPDEEFPELIYKPDTDAVTEDDFLELFHKNRERDRLMKSTQQGPHRDDIVVRLQSRKARDYASEGQQRSLIISLKIAQLQYLHQVSGVQPVLLADDVLGELDHDRKRNFWEAVGDSIQVIATGTVVPTTDTRGRWQVFHVNNGNFTEQSRP